MEEMHRVKYVGRIAELPRLLHVYNSSSISEYSPTRKLATPCPFGFLWRLNTKVCLIKSLAIVDWFNLQPFTHPGRSGGWNSKFQPANHMVGSPGNQPQSSGTSQSPHKQRYLYHSQYLGNSKGFWSVSQECGGRPNIYEKCILIL